MKNIFTTSILVFLSSFCLHAQTIMNIHQNNGTILQIPLTTIDSITYTINNPGQLATISTLPIGNITDNMATSGGNITSNGGTAITQRGIVWSTSPNPTTANIQSIDGSGSGNYTSNLIGLLANTTYYVRAYAINSAGTAYGNELIFTTSNTNSDFLLGSYIGSSNCELGISYVIDLTEGTNTNEINIVNFMQASIATTAIVNTDNSITLIPNIIEPNLIQLLSGSGNRSGNQLTISYEYQDLVNFNIITCVAFFVYQ